MTFDLQPPINEKAKVYRIWVRRVYSVASILEMSYSELWDLPEQEFLVLEEIAQEMQTKIKQRRAELEAQKQQQGGTNGRRR